MPLDIDPAWEYWTPSDPEVAELLERESRAGGFDGLWDGRAWEAGSLGLRFGRGNPDTDNTYLGYERLVYRDRRDVLLVECLNCGVVFQPDRNGRKYCSDACYVRPGRPKTLPAGAACRVCGAPFVPYYAGHEICSRACAGRLGVAAAPPSRLAGREEEFRRLFTSGAKVAGIAAAMGVSLAQAKRWRRQLGLEPRPTGNHSRAAGQAEGGGK